MNDSRAIWLARLCILALFVLVPTYSEGNAAATGEIVWAAKAPMPTARKELGAATAANGKIYAIGGGVTTTGWPEALPLVEEYDPATNTWRSPRANMPTPRRSFGLVAAENGKIYAIGGCCGAGASPLDVVEEYDPQDNNWTTKARMPTARQGLAVAAVGGKIYAIGGFGEFGQGTDAWDSMATVEEYDPQTDTWRSRADMPTPRGLLAAAAANGKVYAFGGMNEDDFAIPTVEEYNPATNTWRTRARMTTGRYRLGAAALGGKIYAVGGYYHPYPSHVLASVEEYDPLDNTWVNKADMPTARQALGVAASGGKIYAIGGTGSSANFAVVEEGAIQPDPVYINVFLPLLSRS